VITTRGGMSRDRKDDVRLSSGRKTRESGRPEEVAVRRVQSAIDWMRSEIEATRRAPPKVAAEPGDPAACREHARRFSEAAKTASPELKEILIALSVTWNKLAEQLERAIALQPDEAPAKKPE
jgi:hypothetical protein